MCTFSSVSSVYCVYRCTVTYVLYAIDLPIEMSCVQLNVLLLRSVPETSILINSCFTIFSQYSAIFM